MYIVLLRHFHCIIKQVFLINNCCMEPLLNGGHTLNFWVLFFLNILYFFINSCFRFSLHILYFISNFYMLHPHFNQYYMLLSHSNTNKNFIIVEGRFLPPLEPPSYLENNSKMSFLIFF